LEVQYLGSVAIKKSDKVDVTILKHYIN
jgi:hypothetical protein